MRDVKETTVGHICKQCEDIDIVIRLSCVCLHLHGNENKCPAHEVGGEAFLDGAYLGIAGERNGINVALSAWWEEEACSDLKLDRKGLKGCGTTLLIPAFHEPDREETGELGIRDPKELCADLTHAASKWFWPAISWGRLE